MSFLSRFAKTKSSCRRRPPTRRGAAFRPQVEPLETRLTPAAVSVIASLPPAAGVTGAWAGGLVADSHGDLFGTTVFGGSDGVFELVKNGGDYTFRMIYSGYLGDLKIDSQGDLFGVISGPIDVRPGGPFKGSGSVGELVNNGGNYSFQTVYTFSNGNGPTNSLYVDASGDLFGTYAVGGSTGGTSFYELVKGNGGYTFQSFDSITAVAGAGGAGLFSDGHGHFLVFTNGNGALDAYGTLEKLVDTDGSWSLEPVYTFTDATGHNADGIFPWDVMEDADGNFYGITEANSDRNDAGVVFELVNKNGTYSLQILHSFTGGSDGASPCSLIMDANGNLVGTTSGGGINNAGTIFELAKNGANFSFQTFYSFSGGADGSFPNDLIQDAQGNIFGVTEFGGTGSDGTTNGGAVFEVTPPTAPNIVYINNLYQLLLHRSGDAAGVAYWVSQLDAGVAPSAVVRSILNSPEYLGDQVEVLYHRFLHRNADAAGLAYWTRFLEASGSTEQVAAGLVGSPEYFGLHGVNDYDFSIALYQDILGRTGSFDEVEGWTNAMIYGGLSRSQAVMDFLTSVEGRTDLVDSYYTNFLGRSADLSGQAAWVRALNAGVSDSEVMAAILSSAEAQRKYS